MYTSSFTLSRYSGLTWAQKLAPFVTIISFVWFAQRDLPTWVQCQAWVLYRPPALKIESSSPLVIWCIVGKLRFCGWCKELGCGRNKISKMDGWCIHHSPVRLTPEIQKESFWQLLAGEPKPDIGLEDLTHLGVSIGKQF